METQRDANGEILNVGDRVQNGGYVGTITEIKPAGDDNDAGLPADCPVVCYHVEGIVIGPESILAHPGLIGRDSWIEDVSQCEKI